MSATAGWYPDPGGGQGLYRYWDGAAWSAATSPNPAAPAPTLALGTPPPPPPAGQQVSGQQAYGQNPQQPYGQAESAYAEYQAQTRTRRPWGWWLGAAALLVVLVLVGVFVVRGLSGGGSVAGNPSQQGSENSCPKEISPSPTVPLRQTDGRVHGGPLSYPELPDPWSEPNAEYRVPFGVDVASQEVMVEENYAPDSSWVASVLVGELQAGDGFFSPQQGSQIVVRCILGRFYGDNPVRSDVRRNQKATIDGHDAWVVESHLTFDIPDLRTKGELMIVAVVATGSTAGLYYASIPDTRPELVAPARQALAQLQVDG